MGFGDVTRMEAAIAVNFTGTTHFSSDEYGRLASRPYKSVYLLSLLWFDSRRKRSGVDGFDVGAIIKIILFSIKFDKFTGFFDKFPKIIFFAIDCNQRSCHINLSVAHSDSGTKKVFRHPRIFPQSPAFAHRRGFGSTRLMRGLVQQFPSERGVPFGLMNERGVECANQLSSFSFSIRSCFTRATSAFTSSMTSLPQKSFPSTTNVGMP